MWFDAIEKQRCVAFIGPKSRNKREYNQNQEFSHVQDWKAGKQLNDVRVSHTDTINKLYIIVCIFLHFRLNYLWSFFYTRSGKNKFRPFFPPETYALPEEENESSEDGDIIFRCRKEILFPISVYVILYQICYFLHSSLSSAFIVFSVTYYRKKNQIYLILGQLASNYVRSHDVRLDIFAVCMNNMNLSL